MRTDVSDSDAVSFSLPRTVGDSFERIRLFAVLLT